MIKNYFIELNQIWVNRFLRLDYTENYNWVYFKFQKVVIFIPTFKTKTLFVFLRNLRKQLFW